MRLTLKIWRQKDRASKGRMVTYQMDSVTGHMSFLEMLDLLNLDLARKGEDAVAFDHDCREGICGSCGLYINGRAHGPLRGVAVCQLHMRSFKDGDTIVVEPFRSRVFPVIKDLVVDRTAFDNIIAAGGYVAAKTGPHPDANVHLVGKDVAEAAMDAAACIGCGACVAACPNASASLFTSAKITQMALLPQGQPERNHRVIRMVEKMDGEGFGNCTNVGECYSACPKEISIRHIATLKREYLRALFFSQ